MFLLVAANLPARAQQGGSLADAARQARAQKQSEGNVNQAQQVAAELSDDQNDDAPGGFKTYNAGDYKLWVPAPYRIDGHDDAGVVLSGPNVGSKHPIVLIGTPIAVQWQNNDTAFDDTATQFSHLYAQTASCAKTTIANHAAYQCGLAAANLLGTHVSGNAVFVLGSGSVYPVFCVSPSDSTSRDVMNEAGVGSNVKARYQKNLSREDDDSRSVYQKCDAVFQSIRLKQDISQQQTARTATVKNAGPVPSAAPAQNSAPAAPTAAASANDAPGSTVPAGFKVHRFNYCKSQNECWNASVLVPADAQLVSSSCKQYAFESKVQGTTFVLLAGPASGDCNGKGGSGPDLVRWNQLVDPENKRAPGSYSMISSQTTKLDGKPAIITTISFRKGLDYWMGKRAELESNGVPLVVGCMAPRDHFADGEAICSKLIESFEMP